MLPSGHSEHSHRHFSVGSTCQAQPTYAGLGSDPFELGQFVIQLRKKKPTQGLDMLAGNRQDEDSLAQAGLYRDVTCKFLSDPLLFDLLQLLRVSRGPQNTCLPFPCN